jgi:hypothetical protein
MTKLFDLVAQIGFEIVDVIAIGKFIIVAMTPAIVDEVGQEAICVLCMPWKTLT